MAQLHLDCSSGMAGSMLVGLCLDLGVSFDKFSGFIHSLGLSDYEVIYEKVKKRGISSSYFDIKLIKSDGTITGTLAVDETKNYSNSLGIINNNMINMILQNENIEVRNCTI